MSTWFDISRYSNGDNADGGNFADYSSGNSFDGGTFTDMGKYHHLYALSNFKLSTDDVVITGVSVTDTSETPTTVLFGTTGYVISLEGNKLIQSQSDAQTVANSVGAKLVGMRFRPCNFTAISDPSREAGDIAYVTDRKQNTYQTFMSNVSFGIGQMDKISCDAESPSRNSATRYDVVTKAIIDSKKHTDTKLTAYDLMVQQLSNLISHSFGFYSSEEILPDGSKIYYKHDKPTRAESMKIWKETIDAFAVSTDGGVTWNAGFDVDGNAVFNVLSAIGINADWIRTGKLLSNDGATLIDMAYGVANSDNISFTENIQSGFPLTMPFNIDDSVSKINKVLLKFTQQAFRTYSDTASSGGGTSSTTSTEGSITNTSSALDGSYYGAMSGNNLTTSGASGTTISHTHTVNVAVSGNIGGLGHIHSVPSSAHSHSVTVPDHTHNLNFGIKEQAISNNEITVYVDGTLRSTTSDTQGIIDLTAFITAVGWHTIEVKSTTLKRISAQVVIKSYIRS